MNIHYFQHVPFEGLGSIEPWAIKQGHEITCSRLYLGDKHPPVDRIDWLIILGGPMSVNDELEYPWLVEEMEFIKQAIEAGKTILGICLGAQLLTKVIGSHVYPNSHKEIGWFPVEKVGKATEEKIGRVMADVVTAFHWHGETFDIPLGAVHLARSEGCENQAFVYGDRVIGLQYHLETTKESAEALIKHCLHEIVEAKYIQSEQEMLSDQSNFNKINIEMERLLDHLQTTPR
jgi:GMP synthase-like glutamine amidotransferase